jgi:prepilin-type N-terminal cleavage/methylation domain-containing protein
MQTKVNIPLPAWKGRLPVEWHIDRWEPAVQMGSPVPVRPADQATKPLLPASIFRHPARRKKPLSFMKNRALAMRSHRAAFTLVELLTVIAIIAILAAMLLPVLSAVRKHALVTRATTEIQDLANAITAYESDYSRFPVTSTVQSGGTNVTLGLFAFGGSPAMPVSLESNSNTMAILMDLTVFSNNVPTVNNGHQYNPKQVKYIAPKMSGYTPKVLAGDLNAVGGVDTSGVYRDPWGNPYIISMNLTYDNRCRDAIYDEQAVSQNPPGGAYSSSGFYGLSNTNTVGSDDYLFNGKVMVWSAGPDRQYTNNVPANQGVNKDNIVSWQ